LKVTTTAAMRCWGPSITQDTLRAARCASLTTHQSQRRSPPCLVTAYGRRPTVACRD